MYKNNSYGMLNCILQETQNNMTQHVKTNLFIKKKFIIP